MQADNRFCRMSDANVQPLGSEIKRMEKVSWRVEKTKVDRCTAQRLFIPMHTEEHLLTIILELQQLHPWYCLYSWLFFPEFI